MNKLAEYAVTQSPRRRRTIILGQIKPPTYVTHLYEDGRGALVRHFSDPLRDTLRLVRMAEGLRDKAAIVEDPERKKGLLASARALEAYAGFAAKVRIKNVLAVPGLRRNADLVLAGVRVVVCPDICFLDRSTERRVGALKFHFPAAHRLDTEALRYAAAILFSFLGSEGDSPNRSVCIAVDVMGAKFECAPKAMKDRIKNLESACEEVAERWPALFEVARATDLVV